jgi:Spy/CpxP family protein refolding chaperone
LLISLGLNLGLGLRLYRGQDPAGDRSGQRGGGRPHRFGGHWADRDSVTRQRMFQGRLDRLARDLNLDPDQREVFAGVHAETGRLLMRKRLAIARQRERLHELVAGEAVDQDRIRSAIAELGQEQAVLDSLVAETVLQEMAVLRPDQRGRYLEILSFEKQGPDRRRGRGGRGGRR